MGWFGTFWWESFAAGWWGALQLADGRALQQAGSIGPSVSTVLGSIGRCPEDRVGELFVDLERNRLFRFSILTLVC